MGLINWFTDEIHKGKEFIGGAMKGIGGAAKSGAKKIGNAVKQLPIVISDGIGLVGDGIKQVVHTTGDIATEAATQAGRAIGGFQREAIGGAASGLGQAFTMNPMLIAALGVGAFALAKGFR